jgi:NAD(P)H-hydrate repair Nnr-like enzyme with NAD(P)H-hydrate epimerase domain
MSAETRKVLDMLAEGKITSADAERLLDKLAAAPDGNGNNGGETSAAATATAPKKYLRVQIERPGGDDVNVRIPLTFVRSGVKLGTLLPPKVMEKLQMEGIDSKFFMQNAGEALDELHVDMDTKSGKRVRVFCE